MLAARGVTRLVYCSPCMIDPDTSLLVLIVYFLIFWLRDFLFFVHDSVIPLQLDSPYFPPSQWTILG